MWHTIFVHITSDRIWSYRGNCLTYSAYSDYILDVISRALKDIETGRLPILIEEKQIAGGQTKNAHRWQSQHSNQMFKIV